MYRTEKERKDLWEQDQIRFAELAHNYPCCDVPTVRMCAACEIEPELCSNKGDLIKAPWDVITAQPGKDKQ